MLRLAAALALLGLALPVPALAQTDYPVVELSDSFFNDRSVFTAFDFYGSLAAPDGGFYVLTASNPFENKRAALGRYTAGGRADTVFGGGPNDWYRTIPWPGDGEAALTGGAVQPDGKILTVGRFDPKNSTSPEVAFAARFNPDGSLDTTFGTDGTVTLPGDLRDTRPLLGIEPLDGGRSVVHFGERVWLSAAGAIDSTTAGATRARPVVLPDGRLLGLERSNSSAEPDRLLRFNADGTRDATFGTDGVAELPGMKASSAGEAWQYRSAAIVPDAAGRIYVYGAQNPTVGNEIAAVARFTSEGSLDATFGTGGVVAVDLVPGDDRFYALAFLPGDRILLTGVMETGSTSSKAPFVMLTSDGTLDGTFGAGGIAELGGGRALSLHPTSADSVVVGLRTGGRNFQSRTGQPLLVKIAVGTGNAVAADAGPSALRLLPPAPNPSRGAVRLRATLARAAPVRVAVLDALGRAVAVPLDGHRPAGGVELTLPTGALAPGAYLVRWQAGGAVATQRLTVIR